MKDRRPRVDFVLSREVQEAAAAIGKNSDVAACKAMRGAATRRAIREQQYRTAMQHKTQGTNEPTSGYGATLKVERSAPYANGETKMNMREYAGDFFLKVDDLSGSGPKKVTIDSVADGSFGKPVAKFTDGSLLSINATNAKTLIRAYGEESDDWVDQVVELYIGQTQFKGQPTDSILVRPVSPDLPISKRTPPKPADDIDDSIPF